MILGFIEHDLGKLNEFSLQMLSFAKQTAEQLDLSLGLVVLGENGGQAVEEVKGFGPDSLFWVRHERLQDYAPEAWAASLHQLVQDKQPQLVLAGSTDKGNEVMAHIAARAGLPMAANCLQIEQAEPFRITRQRWGGSLLEHAELQGEPKLLTVAQYAFEPAELLEGTAPEVEIFTPSFEDRDFRVRFLGREETAEEGVTLKNAPVVVGGGRGVGSEEGYSVLEQLADQLGGVVGGSRVATNNGWRPHADQIGSTGNRIAPDLYIACGISGAIQHLVGCKGAKRIMVINKDPEAPFFSKADYGVLGDLHEVVPAIVDELRKST
jgi:electron transfer flavoprotein alpha subunit